MNGKRAGVTWDLLRGALKESGASPETMAEFDQYASRREFLRRIGRGGGAAAALAAMGVGTDAALHGLFGRGLIPRAWAGEAAKPMEMPGKPGMTVYSTRPYNGEFGAHELDDAVTPIARHFVRNNGNVPERANRKDPQGWSLTIDGEVHRPLKITLDELKSMPSVTHPLLIECGGNGRSFFDPPVPGNQWKHGAIGCSRWTGVPLRHLLERAGLKDKAVYTAHYGEDPALSGTKEPISRGVPIAKAMEEHTLVAYGMNGEDIPALHGYPVRLVVPGWIGSCSQKWLTRIWIRDRVHDGEKMTGTSYRMPTYPVAPGAKVPSKDMAIATRWLVKSMITRPGANSEHKVGQPVQVRGHAWAGDNRVDRVMLSTDFGVNWVQANIDRPDGEYAWWAWDHTLTFKGKGYYEIWARATDVRGDAQPFIQPWNPRGYMSNVVQRLPIVVG